MSSQEGSSGRGDILVVDDTPANLRLLTQVLQDAGHRVRTVTTGTRALAAARRNPPALVLLDLRLPDSDGVAVCAELKADPLTSQVPVIFISAFDDPRAKIEAFAAGGVDYVVKPINPAEVLARVATHLALRDLHQRLQVANDNLTTRLGDLARANADLQRQISLRQAAEETSRRLLEHEQRRALRLDALRDAMNAIAGALDLPSAHIAVLERASELLGSCWGAVARPIPPGDSLRLVAIQGLAPVITGMAVPWGSGLIGEAAATRQIVSRARTEEAFLSQGVAIAAPLVAGDRLEGVVLVAKPEGNPPFDSEDEQLLALFAQQAAIAFQNARLFEEVQHLARTDPLTGLYNRRHFFELAQRELERVRRSQGAMAVLLLDIDNFKQINDSFGHQAGDSALCAIADLLRDSLRAADVSARYGGEELVVLLPDTSMARATAAAERLRSALNQLAIETRQGLLTLTASFGVAAIESDPLSISLDTLLAHADEACYAAKRAGRNRVIARVKPTINHRHG